MQHVPDAKLFAIAFAALACCIVWLGAAAWRHRRNLRAIPVRIHVAGTRGKSTTTRLIAAGLRAGGLRVVAKTTGTEPRLIRPDGSEVAWPRRGPPSVREQTRFLAKAVRLRADAAVVECMAIRPEMVFASEHHLIRATTAVITNARADHLEEIGEHPDAAADAVRWAVPVNGRLFVAAEAATPALRSSAQMRGTDIIVVDTAGLGALAADRALALAVCAAHGVPAAIAGEAMDSAASDPGGFFARDLAIGGKAVRFANAFACNNVASLALLWGAVDGSGRPVVLLNARRDRPLRTRQFLEFLAAREPAPIVFVAGDPLALLLARRAGFKRQAVRRLRSRTAAAALAELAASASAGAVIWGVGNYRGIGARLIEQLQAPPYPPSRAGEGRVGGRPDVLTAALTIGIVVSLALTEVIGLSAGGIIVPGYVALLLDRPMALAGFLVVAAASYGIVRALSMVLMLYGSRRFAVAVLTGLTLGVGAQWASLSAPLYVEWVGLGLIVPGLLAHQFDRQGVLPTLAMLAIAAPLVRLILHFRGRTMTDTAKAGSRF